MGNTISPCCQPNSNSSVKLIFWEGITRVVTGKTFAGEIMFEFPNRMVCHADSFFIGHPIPSLGIDDELMTGQSYFVLPIDCFPCSILTASSLAVLGSSRKRAPINFSECPFQHIKDSNGKVLIKVLPGFIIKLITRGRELTEESTTTSFLCSTPELKKHYYQLVGYREQVWSPKLETISEYKTRFSPCRFIGLEWKQREQEM